MKNKKNLFFIIMFACVLLIGSTIAYYTSYDTFSNLFKASSYTVEVQETFESPDNWLPGDTTPKTVIATNKGETKVAVRIKLTPSWEDSEGNSLPLVDSHDNPGAIINFNENLNEKWTYEDGYYYYNLPLEANESTTSLMESVTFNPDFEIGGTTECTTNEVTHKESCITNLSGYSGGKYKLLIEVETCQYDHYPEIWPTGVPIAEPDSLYNVLMNASNEGTYAAEYTDAHHDSFTVEPTKKIYYYHADNDTEGVAIYNQNNVLFAGQCWQMIRTTDTGGVKLLYNGVADNNKCLNTREPGYGSTLFSGASPSQGSFCFSDGFEYNRNTQTFKLKGNTFVSSVGTSQEEFANIAGKYFCYNSNCNADCEYIYRYEEYNNGKISGTQYKSSDQYYSTISTNFNSPFNADAYAGYMYNSVYDYYTIAFQGNYYLTSSRQASASDVYISDSVVWSTTHNCWALNNPTRAFPSNSISTSLLENIPGKYISNSSNQCAFYAISASTYSYGILNYTYVSLSDDSTCTNHPCFKYGLNFATEYETNSDGTATLINPTYVSPIEFANVYENYNNYYFCTGNKTSCTNLLRSTSTYSTSISYKRIMKFGSSFDYIDGKYHLKNISDVEEINPEDLSFLNNYHYTCINTSGICDKVYYIFFVSDNSTGFSPALYSVELSGGEDASDALFNSLHANNVNQTNSNIKSVVDSWYRDNMQNYTSYLEDTIFCNNRIISSLAGWNPNGGNVNSTPTFETNSELTCQNQTDQFSINNPKARLTYPVGLQTIQEYNLMNYDLYNKPNDRKYGYWLMSPVWIYYGVGAGPNNGVGFYRSASDNVSWKFGVRPVVSLKPGTMYVSGNGTMEYPYVIR